MHGKYAIGLAGALLAGALIAAPAPAAAGDSFHLSLGIGAPVYPYVPAPVVVPPYYYGGAVVMAPRGRWHHPHWHYAPPRHYVWTIPPRHWHGRPGHDRRWR
ncbi:MAG: hypothetical protein ACOZHQ_05820 [Thermodesulfobacteriota bacterium]